MALGNAPASNARTVSTFLEESQRGMEASLCLHFSGASVFMQSSHTCGSNGGASARQVPRGRACTAHQRNFDALKDGVPVVVLHLHLHEGEG